MNLFSKTHLGDLLSNILAHQTWHNIIVNNFDHQYKNTEADELVTNSGDFNFKYLNAYHNNSKTS